jgi:hypothetical protein
VAPPHAALVDTPPYYAVIFASEGTESDGAYGDTAERMVALANETPGFIRVESVGDAEGLGITVSYFAI